MWWGAYFGAWWSAFFGAGGSSPAPAAPVPAAVPAFSLFGVNIQAIVGSALGGGMLPAVLTRIMPGTRTPGSLASGTNATTSTHRARGIVSDYTDRQVDGTMVKVGDRKVMLLAATISPSAIPMVGDRVSIAGATYTVVRVTSDPAYAEFELQVRNP